MKVAHADHDLARARMRREAEALAAVGTPAGPAYHGTGVLADGRAWIEMERITGVNVADLIAAGPISARQAIQLGLGIIEAIGRVHEAKLAHRDVKPDNLVRRSDGTIVILDLGLARKLPVDPDDPTRAGVQVGSLEYMAPEQQLDAAAADARADIYAFGCVLYELCTGRPPFVGDAAVLERAHAALRPPPLSALAQVPEALEQLCHDCLAKQPGRRPASAAEVVARLRAVGDSPAMHKVQHSVSVISQGKQPVVLLWAELPRVDRALLGMLAARKIAVVSQRGRRVLGGVIGAEHADPAGAAIAAARDLAAQGARVALHLEALHVMPKAGGSGLAGLAVEKPEGWLPGGTWTGVVLTRALATVAQTPTRPSELEGFVALGGAGETTELFGRDALVSDLAADAAAALGGAGPGLALVVGDAGVGKTALAAALAPRLRELAVRVHAAAVPPPGSGRPGHSALAELIGTPSGPVVRAVGDAIRAAARAQPTAIVLDDLHLAEHELLDALEYATLGGEPLDLWILGVAASRLDQRRPGFGGRAERHRRDVLAPLDEDAAVAMTAALLRPAEYPPLRALRQIAGIARGNPMHLTTLAREIHDRGAIRTRPNGEHFLDTTALDGLPPIALGPWLAARELADLAAELVALARLCAVLGDDFERAELAAVVEAVERRGGATTTIDVDVGLTELEHAGILGRAGDRWVFRQALLEEGVYATTNEDERRALHAEALAYWRGKPADDAAVATRIARHAEAVGDRPAAAAAFATLGDRAHAEHRELDADQAWQGALRNLEDSDPAAARALLGRARARYRLQRRLEALADLERARALADAAENAGLAIEILLEEAIVHDWDGNFDRARSTAELARARFAALPDTADAPPELANDIALAEGRALFRTQRFAEAIPQLQAVIAIARAGGQLETETIARVLLGPSLVEDGQLDEAERVFADLIAICEQRADRFHLAVSYANRAWLWSKRGLLERTAEDLRLVIQLAREGGQAQVERIATYNMAEDLLWKGLYDEALRLARRSMALQLGHGEGSAAIDRILVARILAARRDRGELSAMLAAITRDELADEVSAALSGEEHIVVDALRAVAEGAPEPTWQHVLAQSASLPASLRLEVAILAARDGHLRDPWRAEIVQLASSDPIFVGRLREF